MPPPPSGELRHVRLPRRSSGDTNSSALETPRVADTLRLSVAAMASDFEVLLPAGPAHLVSAATDALDLIGRLEDQLSVYRPDSELSRLNARAGDGPVVVETRLFDLLRESVRHADETEGAFDLTSGALVSLWRRCRRERRAPTDAEISEARGRQGAGEIEFDPPRRTVRFRRRGIELNLNAIGKGYALDRAGEVLAGVAQRRDGDCVADAPGSPAPGAWLLHGGHSSLLARGSLAGGKGWPIALAHPLFPRRSLGTLRLCDRAMSVSGSGVQFFRAGGQRYGHLLDPRSGWPAAGMLSAVVLAPTAALAEALSTAFFVLGVEKARAYCHNHPEVAALLVPAPTQGRTVAPINCGIPEEDLTLAGDL